MKNLSQTVIRAIQGFEKQMEQETKHRRELEENKLNSIRDQVSAEQIAGTSTQDGRHITDVFFINGKSRDVFCTIILTISTFY